MKKSMVIIGIMALGLMMSHGATNDPGLTAEEKTQLSDYKTPQNEEFTIAPDNCATDLPPAPALTNAFTLGEPADRVLQFLGNSTNWMVAAYGIMGHNSEGDRAMGAGIGAFYGLNEFTGAGLRLDYLDGELWMPSGNFQLQVPIKLGKYDLVPFMFGGMATPMKGKGVDDNVVGIFGAGLALRITDRLDIVYDMEKWTGFPENQHRFGLLWKF